MDHNSKINLSIMTKLSPKQIEIVGALRAGCKMRKYTTSVSIQTTSCSTATFFVLLNAGLIRSFGKWNFGIEYRLTNKGKSIQL